MKQVIRKICLTALFTALAALFILTCIFGVKAIASHDMSIFAIVFMIMGIIACVGGTSMSILMAYWTIED